MKHTEKIAIIEEAMMLLKLSTIVAVVGPVSPFESLLNCTIRTRSAPDAEGRNTPKK
jgi:hypothetical protein